jgi:hypothetical protein
MATKAKKRRCKGTTKAGKRCGAAPLKPGTVIEGVNASGDFCRPHDPAIPSVTQLTDEDRRRGGEGTRRARPDDILRERIEADLDRWLAPLEAALGEGKPIRTWDGKQHKIVYVGDPKLGMAALKLAFERVYGRPRQQVELTGADGGAVKTELELTDPKVQEALHGLVCAVADTREG